MKRMAIVVAVAAMVTALPAAASGQATGEIGGPPTFPQLPFPPPQKKTGFPKARSEAIVIGVGSNPFGRVEIVGQDTKAGLCIFVDQPWGNFSGSCGVATTPRVIAPGFLTWRTSRRRSNSLSELSGLIQPGVASVTATAHRRKGRRRTAAVVPGIVAVPGPDILAKLHQSTPFGFFVADFRGCLADAKVRFNAFDAGGFLLGTSKVNLAFPKRFTDALKPCHPGGGFVFFGAAASARTAVRR